MKVIDILETAQYVFDKQGQQTAVLLDLSTWQTVQKLLEEFQEDERLGALMTAIQEEEKFEGEEALALYQAYLSGKE